MSPASLKMFIMTGTSYSLMSLFTHMSHHRRLQWCVTGYDGLLGPFHVNGDSTL